MHAHYFCLMFFYVRCNLSSFFFFLTLFQNEVVRCNSFALSIELAYPVYGHSHMCQMLVKSMS